MRLPQLGRLEFVDDRLSHLLFSAEKLLPLLNLRDWNFGILCYQQRVAW